MMKNRREINVFISSTFSDMQEERDYLINYVFPDIERECRKRNVYFKALDLRWGITEEESKEGRVIEICIDQIRRSHPFFIGLVGGRYGWVPEDEQSLKRVAEHNPDLLKYLDKGLSITEIEMLYGALDSEDSINAFFYLKDPKHIAGQFREKDPRNIKRLDDLRTRIRKAATEGRCFASDYKNVRQLGKLIRKQILEMVCSLFPEEKLPLLAEIQARQDYRLNMLRRAYNSYRASNPAAYFKNVSLVIVHGDPGTGSSALVANEVGDTPYIENFQDGIRPVTVYTFVDEDVSTVEKLKRQFIYKLSLSYPEIITDELDYPENRPIPFQKILGRLPEDVYLLWIIDGPEHLKIENERTLTEVLNEEDGIPYIIIVTSDNDLTERIMASTTRRGIDYGPEPRTGRSLREIASAWLAVYGKKLNERQISAITASRIFSNVKRLRMFIEILAKFGVYEDVDKFIASFVNVDTPVEFNLQLLEHLEKGYGRERIASLMTRLNLSDYGYPEEILYSDFRHSGLETAALSALLEFMTVRRNALVAFRDGDMREALNQRYPTDNRTIERMWRPVAEYAYNESKRIFRKWSHNSLFNYMSSRFVRTMVGNYGEESSLFKFYYRLAILGAIRSNDTSLLTTLMKRLGLMVFGDEPEFLPELREYIKKRGMKTHSFLANRDILFLRFFTDDRHKAYAKLLHDLADDKNKVKFRNSISKRLIPRKWKKEILDFISDEEIKGVPYVEIGKVIEILEKDDLSIDDVMTLSQAANVALSYRNSATLDALMLKIREKLQPSEEEETRAILIYLHGVLAARVGRLDYLNDAICQLQSKELPSLKIIPLEILYLLVELCRYRTFTKNAAAYAERFIKTQESLSEMSFASGKSDFRFLAELSVACYQRRLGPAVEDAVKDANVFELFSLRRVGTAFMHLGLYPEALSIFNALRDRIEEVGENYILYLDSLNASLEAGFVPRIEEILHRFQAWYPAHKDELGELPQWYDYYFRVKLARLKNDGTETDVARQFVSLSEQLGNAEGLEYARRALEEALAREASVKTDSKEQIRNWSMYGESEHSEPDSGDESDSEDGIDTAEIRALIRGMKRKNSKDFDRFWEILEQIDGEPVKWSAWVTDNGSLIADALEAFAGCFLIYKATFGEEVRESVTNVLKLSGASPGLAVLTNIIDAHCESREELESYRNSVLSEYPHSDYYFELTYAIRLMDLREYEAAIGHLNMILTSGKLLPELPEETSTMEIIFKERAEKELAVLEELCYAYRGAGRYKEGLQTYKRLKDRAEEIRDNYFKYLNGLYPPVTALLAEDYADFDRLCEEAEAADDVTPELLDLLRCVYMLKVGNLESERKLRATLDVDAQIRKSQADEDGNDSIYIAFEAYRLLEAARYHLRNPAATPSSGTVTPSTFLASCAALLARIPTEFLWLHHEFAKTSRESSALIQLG